MVPEGWSQVLLSQVAKVNPSKEPEPEDGLVAFIPMDAVSENAQLQRTEIRSYSEVEKGFTSFRDRDVLIAKITPCFENGKGAYVDRLKNGIGFGSTEFHVIRATEAAYSPFLYYLTTTKEFRVRGEQNMQGSAGQKRVPTDYLKLLKILTPPLPEQKKIAQILSTWDQAITATERLLENSQQRKKGLMQQLLTGKKRLPGFEGEWEEVALSKLADYVKGYTYKSNEYSEEPTKTGFLTLKSLLRGGGYSKGGLKYLTTDVDDKFLVKENDIVFAVTDITRNAEIVGAPLLVPDLGLPQVAISMDMVKLVVKQGVVPKFLYFALKRSPARNYMRSRANGSTVLHLDVKGSKKLSLPIPKDAREQEAISEVLTIADQEIEALSQRSVWLKHEKKALMQQLLTGKRRVNVEAEAA